MIAFDSYDDFYLYVQSHYYSKCFEETQITHWRINPRFSNEINVRIPLVCFHSLNEFYGQKYPGGAYPHLTVEEFLQSELVPKSLKKLIIFNLNLFL